MKAQRVYADGSVAELDATAQLWTSSDTQVAIVSPLPDGTVKVTGRKQGRCILTVRVDGAMGSADLNVTDARLLSLAVSPTEASVPVGLTRQFTASGSFSDGTTYDLSDTVTWSSSDLAKATVSYQGLAIGYEVGRVTLTATSGSVSATASLDVTPAVILSIAVTPAEAYIPVGMEQQFAAHTVLSDGTVYDATDTVTWTTSNSAVAAIDAMGRSTGVMEGGPVTLTATLGALRGTARLTVIATDPACVPGPEVCDGVDNDCDGQVDNGNPGGGEACTDDDCGAGITASGWFPLPLSEPTPLVGVGGNFGVTNASWAYAWNASNSGWFPLSITSLTGLEGS